jgi:hypothetical protein
MSSEFSSLITFELDNVKDFSARSTSWSKTIILPGTANNNKIFGHVFRIGQSNGYNSAEPNVNYNFNAGKSARCVIFQNQMQSFKGVLRLLQINIVDGSVEYEVAVFGELVGLNSFLSGKFLTDLDFSAYDHIFNYTNIINSWSAAQGSGYYYPLIDYGTYSVLKKDWDIQTFRPGLYAKEYIDKMFTAAGYRYSSDLFSTVRFKSIIVPHNQKTLSIKNTLLTTAAITSTQYNPTNFAWDTITAGDFSLTSSNQRITYNGVSTINGRIVVSMTGKYKDETVTITFYKNNTTTLATVTLPYYIGSGYLNYTYSPKPGVSLNTNDYINCVVSYSGVAAGNEHQVFTCTVQFISDVAIPVAVTSGDTIVLNDTIPQNIRQIDFLVGIVKLFNLYIYEDAFNEKLLNIKPYVDFYSERATDADDWTYKMNRNKAIKIKPMSEINAKKYEFKYKQDSDYYNELYRKRYSRGYGDYVFDSDFEFAQNTDSFEILFSATPLVGYGGEDKVFSTIFKRTGDATPIEEKTDSNIRLLQTKRVTGITSWDIKNGVTVLTSTTEYGYAGHLDDPDAPSNDLNFGNLQELFFVLATGDLTNTQFNLYWSSYMAEITDKDSKLVSAYFYLTPKDIITLDFSKKKYVDGILFRLNSIKDYNISQPTDCEVELLKINYLTY